MCTMFQEKSMLIACFLFSHDECVELLLKHGARIDVEARMCWPGPHSNNCEERGKYSKFIPRIILIIMQCFINCMLLIFSFSTR